MPIVIWLQGIDVGEGNGPISDHDISGLEQLKQENQELKERYCEHILLLGRCFFWLLSWS